MFNGKDIGSLAYYNWFLYEFWRFVLVQKEIAKAAHSFIEFPPMQKGATFNLEALREELTKKIEEARQTVGQ
jgi:arylsulfatase